MFSYESLGYVSQNALLLIRQNPSLALQRESKQNIWRNTCPHPPPPIMPWPLLWLWALFSAPCRPFLVLLLDRAHSGSCRWSKISSAVTILQDSLSNLWNIPIANSALDYGCSEYKDLATIEQKVCSILIFHSELCKLSTWKCLWCWLLLLLYVISSLWLWQKTRLIFVPYKWMGMDCCCGLYLQYCFAHSEDELSICELLIYVELCSPGVFIKHQWLHHFSTQAPL